MIQERESQENNDPSWEIRDKLLLGIHILNRGERMSKYKDYT